MRDNVAPTRREYAMHAQCCSHEERIRYACTVLFPRGENTLCVHNVGPTKREYAMRDNVAPTRREYAMRAQCSSQEVRIKTL